MSQESEPSVTLTRRRPRLTRFSQTPTQSARCTAASVPASRPACPDLGVPSRSNLSELQHHIWCSASDKLAIRRVGAASPWRTGPPNNLMCGAVAARNLDAAGHSLSAACQTLQRPASNSI